MAIGLAYAEQMDSGVEANQLVIYHQVWLSKCRMTQLPSDPVIAF